MKKKAIGKGLWIAFFVGPGLLIVFGVILLPLLMSLFNSLFHWNQLLRGQFVGLANFHKILFEFPFKERFFKALENNLIWFCVTMVLQNGAGLLVGYLLSRKIAWNGFYRRVIFIPVLFSIVAVGFLWGLYLRPNGLLNNFLKILGHPELMHAWLGDEGTATVSIILVNIWRWVGFPSLVFLAAIDNVPVDCLEAAYLDGAREGTVFWKVILPLIVPAIAIISVLTIIGSLNVFEQIYTMAGLDGPPNHATDTIGTLFYRTAFGSVDSGSPEIGIGSSIGVVIYLLTFGASILTLVASRRKEVEL